MYLWRKLTNEEREELLTQRRLGSKPWHSPPHPLGGAGEYQLSAACYNHQPIIGHTPARMDQFAGDLLSTLSNAEVHAWCLLTTIDLRLTITALGRLHGRCSFLWNKEEGTRGSKAWHGVADRQIRSEAHAWATINYVHHNPVRHGYVGKWQDWPWSSARSYLTSIGEESALKAWKEFPVLDYGASWDDPSL